MKQPRKTAEETRRATLKLLSTEGLEAAAKAAIDVCKDPNAPAPARATAAGLILRATSLGGFGKSNEAEDEKKPLHAMTAAEIQSELARLRAEAADHAQDQRIENFEEEDAEDEDNAGSAFD